MSLDLLSILSDKDTYNRFIRFIKKDTLSKEVSDIVTDIGVFFQDHPSYEEVDWEVFSDWFRIVRHSSWKEEKLSNYDKIFSRLSSHTPTDVAESIVEKCVTQDYCQRIADVSLKGAEGIPVNLDDVKVLLEEYAEETDRVSKLDTFVVTDDIDEILSTVVTGGYKWRMQFLNRSVGNIRAGKLIAMAARPNTGKTTFLASEATFIASQLAEDECILWFNNEEEGHEVKFRTIQAGIQWTSDDIRSNPKLALDEYKKSINGSVDKIKLIDKADINTKDVEEFIRNHNVKVVVFDQLWKIHGYEKTSATDTARLGAIFQWAREIAKKYGVAVITVHQLKTEAEGVMYPPQSMLYLSGTVIQGEVDTLIMMGRTYDAGQENTRYLSLVKNKGAYGEDVDISLREGKHALTIIPETAEFMEP